MTEPKSIALAIAHSRVTEALLLLKAALDGERLNVDESALNAFISKAREHLVCADAALIEQFEARVGRQ